MSSADLQKAIDVVKKKMEKASKEMEFLEAAKYRDEMFALQEILDKK